MSALPTGYKQTEVGVIPEDWDAKPMGTLTSLMTNGFVGTVTNDYVESEDGVLYVQGYNVEENGFNFHGIKRVSKAFHAKNQKSCLRAGDILTIQTGDIGVTTVVPPSLAGANCHALVISRFDQRVSDPGYYCQYLNSERGRAASKEIETGSTMKHINVGDMVKLFVPVPPLPEQRSIATALSDVDALRAKLDQFIAKKRDLKHASMKQLLTGQTRLPGFSGAWEVKSLNEVCWFQEGPGVRNTQFTTNGVKLLNGTNIFRGALNLDTTTRFISESEAYGPYAHFLASEGDIVLASSGVSIDRLHEKVAFVRRENLPFCMNTSTIRFRSCSEILSAKFLYQFLIGDGLKNQIAGVATGSAQLNFGPSHIAKIKITVPSIPEQTAIATVLSDMDAEIAALEARRDKTRALKQGMMQELLTGRIRLV